MAFEHVKELQLPGVLLVQPRVFQDARCSFVEIWNAARDAGQLDAPPFVQDNIAYSHRGVLRGLHFQQPHPQGKYVAAAFGSIYDVAVDLRPGSATFGRWLGQALHAESGHAIYIPPGFAHGYQTISPEAVVLYKCTEYYHPECDRAIAWNDPELNIDWPIPDPILSEKDRNAPSLEQVCGQLDLRVVL
jgi:dTDP-4-dehydrorhamnose 3,5-epimerase